MTDFDAMMMRAALILQIGAPTTAGLLVGLFIVKSLAGALVMAAVGAGIGKMLDLLPVEHVIGGQPVTVRRRDL